MSPFLLPPDQDQRDRAVDPERSVLVRAPAGSGKTGVLLLRYLRCLLTVSQPEQVVAITFTNKAAGEIKERVLAALQRGVAGENTLPPSPSHFDQAIAQAVAAVLARDVQLQWRLLENSARLRIATFDSFCGSLTRRLPLLSGMGAARPISDTDALYRDAILSLFRQMEDRSCPPELAGALARLLGYGSNRIETLLPLLAALLAKRDQWLEDILRGDIQQMEAALEQELQQQYQALLPLLAEVDIASLMAAFVASSGHCDDHAWAADFDLACGVDAVNFPLLSRLAAAMINNEGLLYKPRSLRFAGFQKNQPGAEAAKAWLQAREAAGQYDAASNAFALLASLPPPCLPASSRQLVADFRCALRYLLAHLRLVFEQQGGVDFGEIAQRAIYALRQDGEGISDAVLQEDRIAHILVDEMQDTSVSQIRLLENLCQDWQPGDGRSVFFCGDLQQSIYAFRGSLVALFDDLAQRGEFAHRPLELLQLSANFRSSPALVQWVNRCFDGLFSQRGLDYVAAQPQRREPGEVYIHPQVQADKVQARRQAAAREAEEMIRVIQRVHREDAARGETTSIAVLVRNRRHLAQIIPALKQAGIAFSGQDIDTLAQTAAVLDFTALLRALWHEADDVAWARLLRAPFVGLSWEDLRRLRQAEGLLRDAVMSPDSLPLSAAGQQARQRLQGVIAWLEAQPQSRDLRWALRSAWHLLGGPACVTAAEARDVDRVLALLDDFAPAGLLEDIRALEAAIGRLFATPPAASVELMTIHKSKGLEFDVVLLPGLGGRGRNEESPLLVWQHLQGHMVFAPKPQADDAEARQYYRYLDQRRRAALSDELDRQLYVALTRARRELHLFGSASENAAGDVSAAANSFLGRLWAVVEERFQGAPVLSDSDQGSSLRVPVAPRMVDWQYSLAPRYQSAMLALSPLQRAQRQTENAVLEDNIEQRATGIVYHELMENLGRSGEQSALFRDRARLERGILQRLRHHCHPEPGLEDSAAQVLDLLDNTRRCETGQWILASYQWQANEQTLRRLVGGQWQTLILDRVFIETTDNTDKCWIIDYKTARASGDIQRFLEEQAARYRTKMAIYRQALQATGLQCPITTALYFPAHQRLVVLA